MGIFFLIICAPEQTPAFESFLKFSLSISEFCDRGFIQLSSTAGRQQQQAMLAGVSVLLLPCVLYWSHH